MNLLTLLLPLAWRNLWRHPRRSGVILVAISVGVWAIVFFNALLRAWNQSALEEAIMSLTGHGQIHATHYLDDPSVVHRMLPPTQPLTELLNSPAVQAWAQRVRVPAVIHSAHSSAPITLVGIQPHAEQGLSFIATAVTQGHYLHTPHDEGVLLGQALAERLKTGLGKRIVVMSQNLQGGLSERGFKIVGIFTATQESTEKAYLFTGLHTAQTLLNMGGALSEIAFVLHDIKQLPQFIQTLSEVVPHNPISSWETLQPFAKAMFQLSTVSITLLGGIMFIAMAFGIVNTLLMAIFERTREIGLLQALGMRGHWIVLYILLESALLIGLGIIMGLSLGILTLIGFHDGLDLSRFAAAMSYWGARKVLYLELNIIDLMIIGSTIWILGLLVSCYPAWRASRYVPVTALNRVT